MDKGNHVAACQSGPQYAQLNRTLRLRKLSQYEMRQFYAGVQPGTVGTKQHTLSLRGIHHYRHNDVALRRQFGRRAAGDAAVRSKGLRDFAANVKYLHCITVATQRARHPAAHGDEADDSDMG